MKNQGLKFGVLTTGIVLTLAQGSARAAMETQTIDFGSALSPIQNAASDSLSYNTFNSTQGTLTGVTITLTSVDAVESQVYDPNGGGNGYANATVTSGNMTVTALGLSTSTSTLAAGPFAGTTTGTITVAGTGTAQTLATQFSPTDLSSFIGDGSSQSFNVSLTPGTATSGGSPTGNQLFFSWAAETYGSIEIEYDYSPVPEPGTFFAGASLLGYAGIMLWRWKKRTQLAPA